MASTCVARAAARVSSRKVSMGEVARSRWCANQHRRACRFRPLGRNATADQAEAWWSASWPAQTSTTMLVRLSPEGLCFPVTHPVAIALVVIEAAATQVYQSVGIAVDVLKRHEVVQV